MTAFDSRMLKLNVPHYTFALDGVAYGWGLNNKKYSYWGEEYARWIRTVADTQS